ncbi:hypothetical protein PAPHI01_1398 [Pancytospora philotis]|nr:hypothetical protein PAPHI01_1398 [Pancytospora philotis]
MKFAGLMLLTPAVLCTRAQSAASSSFDTVRRRFPLASIEGAMRTISDSNGLKSEYVKICERLREWCTIQNDMRGSASNIDILGMEDIAIRRGMEKIVAERGLAETAARHGLETIIAEHGLGQAAAERGKDIEYKKGVIEMVLLSEQNIIDVIRSLAVDFKYGFLEVLYDIFKKTTPSAIEAVLNDPLYTGVAEVETIKNNCTDEQLDRIRTCIQEEMTATLAMSTSDCLARIDGPLICSYTDALAHLLRRKEALYTDFYDELASVFKVLLKHESQRGKRSDFIEPLFRAVAELACFSCHQFQRCKSALLNSIMASDDPEVVDMCEWDMLRGIRPKSYIITYLILNVSSSISPYFLFNAIDRFMKVGAKRLHSSVFTRLLERYFFDPANPSLCKTRQEVVLSNEALRDRLPYDIRLKMEIQAGVPGSQEKYDKLSKPERAGGNSSS